MIRRLASNGWLAPIVALVISGVAVAITATALVLAPDVHTVPYVTGVPRCEGTGDSSFCALTVAPDGTEWLFTRDNVTGTVTALRQTP